MATRRIETTIALDGEQAFKKGLASMSREMRVLESEAKALAASFGTSGDAATAAAAKQRNLQNQVSQQKQIVSALEQAVKDAAKAYGEGSAEVDGYAIKLNNARTRLVNLQKALDSADREVEELGRDSIKAGRQIEEGIGDGAQEAENELTDLMSTMQDTLSGIQSNTAVTAISTIWNTASGAYNAVEGFVSGTVDYRRQLSFLKVNAEEDGFDFSDLQTKLFEVTTITGDTSASIETLSNLINTPGINSDNMQAVIEGLGGAVIEFPDTFKFESLADSLQETLATGEATGPFAELLGRLGIDVEEFNTALEKSPTAAGDLEIAMAYLAQGGLNDVYKKWRETNGEMTEAMETQSRLDDELATFAATLEKYITTPVKNVAANAIEYINAVVAAAQGDEEELAQNQYAGNVAAIAAAAKAVAANPVGEIAGDMGEAARMMLEQVGVSMGIATLGDQIAGSDWAAKIKEFATQTVSPYEAAKAKAGTAEGQDNAIAKFVAWWGGLFGGDTEADAAQAGAETAEQFAAGFEEQLDPTLWGEGQEAMPLQVIGQQTMDEILAGIDLEAYYKEMEAAGSEGGEDLVEGMEEGMEGAEGAAREAGAATGAAYAQGLLSQVSYVQSAANALAAAASIHTSASGLLGGLNLALNLDGKTFGRIAAPYLSDAMAVTT